MSLKLNILPEIEKEMGALVFKTAARSKTEYINMAIQAYNEKVKRQLELEKLKNYFSDYQEEGKTILHEFAQLKTFAD